MKPKAKKFRIRRSAPLTSEASDAPMAEAAAEPVTTPLQRSAAADMLRQQQGGGSSRAVAAAQARKAEMNAKSGEVSSASEVSTETDIEAIRREGLTGRQLRMARRVAQKHGLAPTSDFDAVKLLRDKGIDPFQRSNMLELVVPEGQSGQVQRPAPTQLPQTVPPAEKNLPSTQVLTEEARIAQISKIQRDIAKRRRRKTGLLFMRLAFFVGLPTLIAGYYYYAIATPHYATKSEFVIQQAESQAAGQLGGLFSGTGFATSQDSIAVQSYLESRDAMLRLDRDVGFKAHFSNPDIDPIQRLEENASNEAAYKLYKRNVKLGYDPSEGIIKMEVSATDPAVSARFSQALISYAESRVDNLTQRLRADQMDGAIKSFADAEQKMLEAQRRVIVLKETSGVADSAGVLSSKLSQISTFEVELAQKRLALEGFLSNARPNRARVAALRTEIQNIEALIARMQNELTAAGNSRDSLARTSSDILVAEADLQTRQLMFSQAQQQLETARIEAVRQTRYLSLGVEPVAPDEPTYPRAFENTLLAFLIFSGIYLMASLTASVLREQVTS